ncbi:hypothetical protein RND71_023522 [Anisodus tanguticus]|uniref:Uncharacterized protein n=1 Tax=Anisodus tanguticus TaxID=243964 RepID=A0AAE1RV04_9SOLA|nr:hypothetical protein RND71_023522 [Anisodus tanguticus]
MASMLAAAKNPEEMQVIILKFAPCSSNKALHQKKKNQKLILKTILKIMVSLTGTLICKLIVTSRTFGSRFEPLDLQGIAMQFSSSSNIEREKKLESLKKLAVSGIENCNRKQWAGAQSAKTQKVNLVVKDPRSSQAEINNVAGGGAEMQLIKVLLAKSPALVRMVIKPCRMEDKNLSKYLRR